MPCTKCEEGKYKWGETGECKYDSLDACESANHKYKMQPTPLGKKTYEEYAKELKEFNLSKVERIDLSSLKELQKQITGMKQGMKWITGKLDEGERYVKELNKYRNFSLSIFADLKKVEPKMHIKAQEILDKFSKAAKDLGVDIGSVSEVKEIKKLIEETEQKIKGTEKLFKKFRQAGLKD